jgi:hypothetical protein
MARRVGAFSVPPARCRGQVAGPWRPGWQPSRRTAADERRHPWNPEGALPGPADFGGRLQRSICKSHNPLVLRSRTLRHVARLHRCPCSQPCSQAGGLARTTMDGSGIDQEPKSRPQASMDARGQPGPTLQGSGRNRVSRGRWSSCCRTASVPRRWRACGTGRLANEDRGLDSVGGT